MKSRLSAIALILPLLLGAEKRRWTDYEEKNSVVGTLKSVVVRIEKPDGEVISVEADRLSKKDRAYIAKQIDPEEPDPTPPEVPKISPDQAVINLARAGILVKADAKHVNISCENGRFKGYDPSNVDALKSLHSLPNLKTMIVIGALEDKHLVPLAGLPTLEHIEVFVDNIRKPTGLDPLAKIPSLQYLEIQSEITNEQLEPVGRISSLKGLKLGSTKITDRGLVHLRELKNLESLILEDSKVTKAGLKDLYEHLPKCVGSLR